MIEWRTAAFGEIRTGYGAFKNRPEMFEIDEPGRFFKRIALCRKSR